MEVYREEKSVRRVRAGSKSILNNIVYYIYIHFLYLINNPGVLLYVFFIGVEYLRYINNSWNQLALMKGLYT